MEGRGVMRMGVTMTLYQAASDYWLRYRNSLSVRVSEGALTQAAPLHIMVYVSKISRARFSLYRRNTLAFFRSGVHPQSAQWIAKLLPCLFLTLFACSRRRSLRQRPDWPMYDLPQVVGISYTISFLHCT